MSRAPTPLFSRVFLLAGVADILGNLAGFIFGAALVAAAAALLMGQHRAKGAVLGAVSMAIAAFISIRVVVALLYPSRAYFVAPGLPFSAPALALLMSPSPLFSLISGGPLIVSSPYDQAMRMIDLGFNSAAIVLNFLGLGVLMCGWTELMNLDAQVARTTEQNNPAMTQPR